MNSERIEFAPRARSPLLPPDLKIAAGAGAAALLAVALLLSTQVEIALLLAAGVVALILMARGVYRHPQYLMLSLLLIEVLPSATLLPLTNDQRPIVRYPLYVLFALPLIALVLRSHLINRGGFRLYAIYFAWAFVTASYSLAPAFSFGRAAAASLLFLAISGAALRARSRADVERQLRLYFMGCAALVGLLMVTALVPGLSSYAWVMDVELGQLRFYGYFDSPNQVGELAMVTIGVALFCWPSWRHGAMRIVSGAVIAAALFVLVIADSRSAIVAAGVGAATYAIWQYRWRGAMAVATVSVGLMVVLLAVGSQALPYLNRHDIANLSDRTEVWRFAFGRLARSPILGYGYSVEGAIFNNRYFPLWDDLWMQGPRIPIHNAYLSRAIGLGVPALLLWIFLFFRPFVDLFVRRIDPMNLKPLAILIVLPALILSMSETLGGDCRYPAGLICTFIWAIFEIHRLNRIDDGAALAVEATRMSAGGS